MNWIHSLSKAVAYIEERLTDDINIDEVSRHVYASSSHFQLIFHVVMGMTAGEYIRNRRLSRAAQDLMQPGSKILDVAMRYQYDSQESFSKAFSRFHGVSPSKIRQGKARLFHPLRISVTIQGGFDMSFALIDEFHRMNWSDAGWQGNETLTDAEKYQRVVAWADSARSKNPGVFDALTQWILDDAQWSRDKLAENEQILMQGVLGRFKDENAQLRAYLRELEPSGVVNSAVFKALDGFDESLSGAVHDKKLREAVAGMFADFSVMENRSVREWIAGQKTGPHGTDTVALFGYMNHLKDCDARVQWTLFMPDKVKQQAKGFTVDSFAYRSMPALRFIGFEGKEYDDIPLRLAKMSVLNEMADHASGFDFDILFMHHYGLGVDIGPWHGVWGRFMQADTPVPEGFLHFDLTPRWTGEAGPPYISRFAFATFSGETEAMHSWEGFDGGAMYDITRNIILGENVGIPYPHKYWTAEVFFDGCDKDSTGFLFSVQE